MSIVITLTKVERENREQTRMVANQSFVSGVIPEDGVIVKISREGVATSCYLRNSDFEEILKRKFGESIIAKSW
jgi:hypothetical protein